MKGDMRRLLTLPLLGGFLYAVGAPMLAWFRTLWPALPGWLFWPPFALLLASITLSYSLPRGRLSSTLHIVGEAVMPPMLTLLPLLFPAVILRLLWPGLPVRPTGWVVLALFVLLCGAGSVNAMQLRTKTYALPFDRPFPALRIALISDLHLGAFTGKRMMRRIADAVLRCKPDLVIIAGDLFDDRLADVRHADAALAALGRLTTACPVFACEGNHDLFEAKNPARDAFIARAGIRLLRDEAVVHAGLNLIFRKDKRDPNRLPPARLFERAAPLLPIVAIDHNPAEAESLWAAGADLVLSGHTHGGQTFPGPLLFKLAGVHAYGCRQAGGSVAIVTSGAGTYGTPIRLGVNNEIVLIETRQNPRQNPK